VKFAHTRRVFTCRHAPYVIAPEMAALLAAHYAEPHRAYHDATHIAEVLRWFDIVGDEVGWSSPRDVYDAVLFHDVIYDPKAHDNEERSAQLALAHGCWPRTAELIRLTARHGKVTRDEVDTDAALFLDCDTAILGAPPDDFDAYDKAIAIEYGHVPAAAFAAGRGAFLKMMRERPRLFLTDFFHARLDAAARANLDRAIARYS
jgi:predicted metal-dependent HD superfamily phosphohydrolase